jgi:hypothetical protein
MHTSGDLSFSFSFAGIMLVQNITYTQKQKIVVVAAAAADDDHYYNF